MRFFSLLLSFVFCATLWAEKPDSKIKDEESLVEVCQALSEKKITKGDFRQIKLIFRLKREMVSTGVFVISADDGILWETQNPYASTMVMTKNSLVQINAKGKKTLMNSETNATFAQFANVLSSVFNANPKTLTENFNVEVVGTSSEAWNINLTPKNSSIKKFIASIDMAGHGSIEIMTLHEPNGDYIRYEFMNHIYPEKLTDEEKSAFSEK